MKRLPNFLTWLRIALIPLYVLLFMLPVWWARPAASVVFGIAGLTDWADGYLARRFDVTSRFGAFLDPVADKLLVAAALVMLCAAAPEHGHRWLIAVCAAVIIGREITISALREWMAEMGERGAVAVSSIGKFKTTAQIVALLLMTWREPIFGLPIYVIGLVALVLAAALTLWSMTLYLRAAWPWLRRAG